MKDSSLSKYATPPTATFLYPPRLLPGSATCTYSRPCDCASSISGHPAKPHQEHLTNIFGVYPAPLDRKSLIAVRQWSNSLYSSTRDSPRWCLQNKCIGSVDGRYPRIVDNPLRGWWGRQILLQQDNAALHIVLTTILFQGLPIQIRGLAGPRKRLRRRRPKVYKDSPLSVSS